MFKQFAFVVMVLLMLFVFTNATYWSITGNRPALVETAVDFGYRDLAASISQTGPSAPQPRPIGKGRFR